MKTVIFDIDRTLADSEHRYERHTVNGKIDWDAAHNPAEVLKDPPLPFKSNPICMAQMYFPSVTFLTGRPSSLEEVTKVWLLRYFLPSLRYKDIKSVRSMYPQSKSDFYIISRKNGDYTHADEAKREMMEKLELKGIKAICAFDDCSEGDLEKRRHVYEDYGAKFYHINDHDFWLNFDWHVLDKDIFGIDVLPYG